MKIIIAVRLLVINPWPTGAKVKRSTGEQVIRGELIETDTLPGETIRLRKADS